MKNGRIAIPSVGKGGLDGKRSQHFGHCDAFTIVDVKDGKISNVTCSDIKPVVESLITGNLSVISRDQTCGGGGECHQ